MKFIVNGHNIFLIVSICTMASFIFVQIMKKVATYIGALDYPDKRKIHLKPVPTLGGVGIFVAFLLGYILFGEESTLMLSILIASFLILILGIFDDIKPIDAKYKFIIHIIIASIVVFYGKLEITRIIFFDINFALGSLSSIISVVAIVAIINAINLIDGLDGLCAGISSIYFFTIAVIALLLNKLGGLDIILSLVMLGCCLGYLIHNFPPAKIFMGDTGSTFLGLMIAVIMMLGFKTYTLTSLVIPLLVLAIPILDTIFAIIRRRIHGKPVGQADKEHFHHQLLKLNKSPRKTVLSMYAITAIFSITTILYAVGYKKEMFITYIVLLLMIIFLIFKTNILFDWGKKK
ncbi:MAG: MraY family glycosyltransferase [Bacilli bacterium]